VDLGTGAGDLVAVLVQLQVGDAQYALAALVGHRAAQHGMHPGQQFLDAERLDDVVVGAGAQAADALGRGVARGQEDHRHLRARRAQVVQHAQPVHARHHDVEHHQVRVGLGHRGQCEGPLSAMIVSKPSKRSAEDTRWVTFSSSSTTRTRRFAATRCGHVRSLLDGV